VGNTNQCPVGDSAERVAGGAHFAVDLEPSAETVDRLIGFWQSERGPLRLVVICLCPPLMNPGVLCCMEAIKMSVMLLYVMQTCDLRCSLVFPVPSLPV
jgi:hypothetical protein